MADYGTNTIINDHVVIHRNWTVINGIHYIVKEIHYEFEQLHRIDGPAYQRWRVHYLTTGIEILIEEKIWYYKGKVHRDGLLPAKELYTNNNGSLPFYYKYGKRERALWV